MARRRVEDDDDDDTPRRRRAPVDDDEDDDDDLPPKKPRENAYTGMLAITLLGLIGAAVLFYLHTDALSAQKVSAPTVNLPPLGGQQAPAGTTQG